MILHTIIDPLEMLDPQNTNTVYKTIPGAVLQGVQTGERFTIDRLIATDPKMYLDPRFAPGKIYTEKT